MAFDPIPDSFKKVWDAWGIRGVILLSLSLQIILIFFAPLRKKTSNVVVLFIIWAAYLLADWAAAFAVGLISNSQGQKDSSATASPDNSDLLAFWAPFLLVHLGGPDTITALALEDNAIWVRHLIGLLLQLSAAIYVFLLTLPDNKLVPATIAMLVAGLIKYAERTRALYLASLDKFKESMLDKPKPGLRYKDLAFISKEFEDEEMAPKVRARIAKSIRETEDIPKGLLKDETDVVKIAQYFFEKFKGLIVDLRLSFNDHYGSRSFFMARDSREALKVIMVELNFMYETFYTKVVLVHSWWSCAFRFVAFALESVALVLFIRAKKSSFHSFDVRITFVLLISAVSLDLIATFMVIFSDWLLATLRNSVKDNKVVATSSNSVEDDNNNKVVAQLDKYISPISSYFLKWRTPSYTTCRIGVVNNFMVGNTFVLDRRWAESISAYNLIGIIMKESPRKIGKPMGWFGRLFYNIFCYPLCIVGEVLSFIGLQIMRLITCLGLGSVFNFIFEKTGLLALYEDIRYVVRNPFVIDLWDFIFDELKSKSELAEDSETAKQIFEAKGEWVLQDSQLGPTVARLRKYIDATEYDRSLLRWHIATEICYNLEDPKEDEATKKKKEYSKILSDYMLYLLVKQPSMMSSVAGIAQIRLRDTRTEGESFFDEGVWMWTRTQMHPLATLMPKAKPKQKLLEGCERFLGINLDLPSHWSKSVLSEASKLANEMMNMRDIDKWEVMSKVWVELLAYAASHSRADTHAQLLCKGGELITFVWLLLSHFNAGQEETDDFDMAQFQSTTP